MNPLDIRADRALIAERDALKGEVERLREDFIALARVIEQNDHHATVRDSRPIIRRVVSSAEPTS